MYIEQFSYFSNNNPNPILRSITAGTPANVLFAATVYVAADVADAVISHCYMLLLQYIVVYLIS